MLETINGKEFCNGVDQYNVTKLFQVRFVPELAARLPSPTSVVACTVQPGLSHSRILAINGMLEPSYRWRVYFFSACTSEQGCRMLVHAAVGNDDFAMHGR
ncbi:hypothetical protein EDD16DRAFT_446872 [Pisolithus croceorrhizus]|nr:hypothetical protein EDD16DRAFT_446872 [Pisolithus croceorrhizus]